MSTRPQTEVGTGRQIAAVVALLAVLWSLMFGVCCVDSMGNAIAQGGAPEFRVVADVFGETADVSAADTTAVSDRQTADKTQPDRGCSSHCDQHSRGIQPMAASTHTAFYARVRHLLLGEHVLQPAPCDPLYDPPRATLAA